MLHSIELKAPIDASMPERVLRTLRVRGFKLEKINIDCSEQQLTFDLHCSSDRPIFMLISQLEKISGLKVTRGKTTRIKTC